MRPNHVGALSQEAHHRVKRSTDEHAAVTVIKTLQGIVSDTDNLAGEHE